MREGDTAGLRRALRTPPRRRAGHGPHALPQRRRRPGPGLRGLHAGAGAPSRGEGPARVPPGLHGHGGVAAGRGPRRRPHPHASGDQKPDDRWTVELFDDSVVPGGCRRGGPGLRLPPRAVAGCCRTRGRAPAPSGGSGGGRAAERRVRAGQTLPVKGSAPRTCRSARLRAGAGGLRAVRLAAGCFTRGSPHTRPHPGRAGAPGPVLPVHRRVPPAAGPGSGNAGLGASRARRAAAVGWCGRPPRGLVGRAAPCWASARARPAARCTTPQPRPPPTVAASSGAGGAGRLGGAGTAIGRPRALPRGASASGGSGVAAAPARGTAVVAGSGTGLVVAAVSALVLAASAAGMVGLDEQFAGGGSRGRECVGISRCRAQRSSPPPGPARSVLPRGGPPPAPRGRRGLRGARRRRSSEARQSARCSPGRVAGRDAAPGLPQSEAPVAPAPFVPGRVPLLPTREQPAIVVTLEPTGAVPGGRRGSRGRAGPHGDHPRAVGDR
ncbi:hypothetical protein QJS66_19900 [Kocuria rhizophila]|nr:hypothetical protein QJS66_19900 [Kocuria rhizophila]